MLRENRPAAWSPPKQSLASPRADDSPRSRKAKLRRGWRRTATSSGKPSFTLRDNFIQRIGDNSSRAGALQARDQLALLFILENHLDRDPILIGKTADSRT